MARASGILIRLTTVVLGLLVVAFAAGVLAPPWIVESLIRDELASAGIAKAQFTVESIGWRTARIADIRVGDDVAVDRLTVAYVPLGLLSGRVRHVEIAGLPIVSMMYWQTAACNVSRVVSHQTNAR